MTLSTQTAKHLRDVHFGGNWTVSNLRDQLTDVTWQEATMQVHSLNTIATLVYHTHYFVEAVIMVLEGKPLDTHDKYSFDHPPIQSRDDWEKFLEKVWARAERAATLIEQMPESKLNEPFWDGKYGTYFRNLHGVIEHLHYHLGQIALIKKIIRPGAEAAKPGVL